MLVGGATLAERPVAVEFPDTLLIWAELTDTRRNGSESIAKRASEARIERRPEHFTK